MAPFYGWGLIASSLQSQYKKAGFFVPRKRKLDVFKRYESILCNCPESVIFSCNLRLKCWQKFVIGKCIQGKHSKIKKEHKMPQMVLHILYYKVIQNKAICYSKKKLSAKEIVFTSASINPLKNSGIWNLKQPSYL